MPFSLEKNMIFEYASWEGADRRIDRKQQTMQRAFLSLAAVDSREKKSIWVSNGYFFESNGKLQGWKSFFGSSSDDSIPQ